MNIWNMRYFYSSVTLYLLNNDRTWGEECLDSAGLFHSSALKVCTQCSVDGIHGYLRALRGVVQPVISNAVGDRIAFRQTWVSKHQKHTVALVSWYKSLVCLWIIHHIFCFLSLYVCTVFDWVVYVLLKCLN